MIAPLRAIGWGDGALGFESALDTIGRRGSVSPAVAVGLIPFAIFRLVAAMWLRIRDEDVDRQANLAGRRLQRD